MSKVLTRKQKIILMHSGIEIFIDEEKADRIINEYSKGNMIKVEGRLLNPASIEGFYLPKDLEELQRRKKGQWKCSIGKWHDKNEDCFHVPEERIYVSLDGKEFHDKEKYEKHNKLLEGK